MTDVDSPPRRFYSSRDVLGQWQPGAACPRFPSSQTYLARQHYSTRYHGGCRFSRGRQARVSSAAARRRQQAPLPGYPCRDRGRNVAAEGSQPYGQDAAQTSQGCSASSGYSCAVGPIARAPTSKLCSSCWATRRSGRWWVGRPRLDDRVGAAAAIAGAGRVVHRFPLETTVYRYVNTGKIPRNWHKSER